jgi:hypothetical protein
VGLVEAQQRATGVTPRRRTGEGTLRRRKRERPYR